MRAVARTVVLILALVGAVATIQELRGQAAAPLAAGNFLHVGIAVKDIAAASQMFADVYGVTPPAPRVFDNVKALRPPAVAAGEQAAKAKLVQFTVGHVRVEPIEPTEGATPWSTLISTARAFIASRSVSPTSNRRLAPSRPRGGRWVMGEPGNMSFKYVDMREQLGYTVELGRQRTPAAATPAGPAR